MWSLSALMYEGPFREMVLTTGIILAGFGLAGVVGLSIVVGLFAAAYRLAQRENREQQE
jgi:hypothetical protein